MTAKEFFLKCDEETSRFLKIYFAYYYLIIALKNNEDTKLLSNIYDIKSKKILTAPEQNYFLFLLVLERLHINIDGYFKTGQNNILNYYHFDEALYKMLDNIIEKYPSFTYEQIEEYFQTNLKYNLYIISALQDKNNLTISDIFERLIKNGLLCYKNLVTAFNINSGNEEKNDIISDKEILTYEEFYQKCTPDAEWFFKAYFKFIAKLHFISDSNQTIIEKCNDKALDDKEKRLLLFLYFTHYTKSDVGTMMKDDDVNPEYFYYIDACITNLIQNVLKNFQDSSEAENKYYYEEYFKNPTNLKISFSKLPKITIEQVLDSLIVNDVIDYASLFHNFHFSELYRRIQNLGLAKTSTPKMTIRINDMPDTESIEDLLKRDGEESDDKFKKESTLSLGEELTKKEFEENPLLGREKELRIIGAALLDKRKSLILHGKPGVGKTTLVEGIAYQIKQGTSHPLLRNKRIFEVSATEMVEGTQYRGQLEKKFLKLIKELINIPESILFIDEIHMIMGGGASRENPIDISNMLKPYVGNGKNKIIGSTTTEELKIIAANGAIARRFKTIPIPELSFNDIIHILNRLIENMKVQRQIMFDFSEEQKIALLKLIFDITNAKYQGSAILYNPDFVISILSDAYNFAFYDSKDKLSIEYLIESVETCETVNEEGKNYFKEEAFKRVREL